MAPSNLFWRNVVKKILVAVVVFGVASFSACGTTLCEQVCQQVNTCTVAQRSSKVDCPEFCKDVSATEKRMKDSGAETCHAQFEAHLACWRTNRANVCTKDFSGCEGSATEWTDCLSAYCATHPKDPSCACADEECTIGVAGLAGF
jgi:hypothetical protein